MCYADGRHSLKSTADLMYSWMLYYWVTSFRVLGTADNELVGEGVNYPFNVPDRILQLILLPITLWIVVVGYLIYFKGYQSIFKPGLSPFSFLEWERGSSSWSTLPNIQPTHWALRTTFYPHKSLCREWSIYKIFSFVSCIWISIFLSPLFNGLYFLNALLMCGTGSIW